jgi:hypothetical protein
MPEKTKHLHLYRRVKWGDNKRIIFRCIKPGCKHYLYPEFLLGREAECPVCHEEYILTARDKFLRNPHCPECHTRRDRTTKKVDPLRARSPEELMEEVKRKFGL